MATVGVKGLTKYYHKLKYTNVVLWCDILFGKQLLMVEYVHGELFTIAAKCEQEFFFDSVIS